jgi:septal ring-binding cell division protein DamX
VVSSWLLKVVLGIVVVGLLVLELGSPLVAQAQADGAAHDVADETAFRLSSLTTEQQFQEECATEAAKHSVTIVECRVDPTTHNVVVRVRKKAVSVVLKHWSVTRGWYEREVTATSGPK